MNPVSRTGNIAERLEENRAVAVSLVHVSRETENRLAVFVGLLARWQSRMNLVSGTTLPSVWTRHVADSAQLLALAPGAARWVDMGSGAGFPGIVIAIQLASVPGAVVHCIESDQRKCAFLREAVRATDAPAQIHSSRVEALDVTRFGPVDAVTARAFAPLPLTIKLSKMWLKQGATGVFPRGQSARHHLLDGLEPDTAFKVEILPSIVDDRAAILRIRRQN